MKPSFWLGAVLLLAMPAPLRATPRVTLRLQGATLHQVLRRLSRETGLPLQGPGGAGGDTYREAPGASRVDMDWQNVSLGRALRDVCAVFGLRLTGREPQGLVLQAALKEPAWREVLIQQVAVSLRTAGQVVTRDAVPGRGGETVTTLLQGTLAVRSLEGDAEYLGPMSGLVLVSRTGHVWQAPVESISGPGVPDEREYATLPLRRSGELATPLRSIEGDLMLYDRVETYRLTPITAVGRDGPELRAGPVRVRVAGAAAAGDLTVRLQWEAGSSMVPADLCPLRAGWRLTEGNLVPLQTTRTGDALAGGTASTEWRCAGEGPPVGALLELEVTLRSRESRTVHFRMENVELPFDRPFRLLERPQGLKPAIPASLRAARIVPDAYWDPDGGVLLLPVLRGGARVDVGLSRKRPDGNWSPVRWVSVRVEDEPVRLEGLAPGTYRVRLRAPQGTGQGNFRPSEAGEVVVGVRRGETTVWSAPRKPGVKP